eukprot:298937-Amphidinium_carterae.2
MSLTIIARMLTAQESAYSRQFIEFDQLRTSQHARISDVWPYGKLEGIAAGVSGILTVLSQTKIFSALLHCQRPIDLRFCVKLQEHKA